MNDPLGRTTNPRGRRAIGKHGKTAAGLPNAAVVLAMAVPLVLLLFSTTAPPVAASSWSGIGRGTPEDPFIITTVHQLQAMRYNLFAHYALGNDIDASITITWNHGAGFEPIGLLAGPTWAPIGGFTGSFDGRGHRIFNLHINRPTMYFVGLFSGIRSGAVVKNVGLENASVIGNYYVGGLVGCSCGGIVSNSYFTGAVTGSWTVGGLVGRIKGGTVDNCYFTGAVTGHYFVGGLVGSSWGTIVSNSYSTGAVTGSWMVGGLVGRNRGLVSNSYSTGAVTGPRTVGGLVGLNRGFVFNSYSTGAVSGVWRVGGLVGYDFFGTVSNSYSTGAVTGSWTVGGLAGFVSGIVSNSYSVGAVSGVGEVGGLVGYIWPAGTVSNSYSTGAVTGRHFVGGLVGRIRGGTVSNSFYDMETSGQSDTGKGTPKTTEEMRNVRTFTDPTWSVGLTFPWDFVRNPYHDIGNENIWNIDPRVNNGYPFLSWQLLIDTTPPTSFVNPIEPYWQRTVPFTVSVTAFDDLSGVANVELYYRSSIDNVSWAEWKLYGIDNVAPYEWSFTAPDGYALYEFYSVATDVAGNVEEAPEVADASCGVVIPATIDIDPDTLNLNSDDDDDEWVTAYIELPPGYGVAHVRGEPYEFEMEIEGDLTPRQQELVSALVQEIERTLATVRLEVEAEGGEVEVEVEGYLSEEGVARLAQEVPPWPPKVSPWPRPSARTLLEWLVQELKREGNELELSIEKEVDWGNYRTTIDIPSVRLDNIPAISDPKYEFVRYPELEDRDGNGLPELMVKFDRAAVQALVSVGDVELVITGKWHAVLFEGSDRVLALVLNLRIELGIDPALFKEEFGTIVASLIDMIDAGITENNALAILRSSLTADPTLEELTTVVAAMIDLHEAGATHDSIMAVFRLIEEKVAAGLDRDLLLEEFSTIVAAKIDMLEAEIPADTALVFLREALAADPTLEELTTIVAAIIDLHEEGLSPEEILLRLYYL
jgi:hypothetical protein